MSKSKSNNISTITVALTLCLVCSVMVSAVAVGLKPKQEENARLDINKNILIAAGDFDASRETNTDVAEKFKGYDVKMVNLSTGVFASEDELKQAGIDNIEAYSTSAASSDPALSDELGDKDTAGIGRLPKYAKVFIKNDANGQPESIVLPVYGAGLWGKIYGFLTLEGDANTIKGISFYSHKETPGLGALIEENKFRDQFTGLQAYDGTGNVVIAVKKAGQAKMGEVDGISGATLTTKGVNNFIQFWLSDSGYKSFLDNLNAGKAGEV